MAKGSKTRQRIASQRCRLAPKQFHSFKGNICENDYLKKCSKSLDKKDWKDATCSVCMEFPHNAVLLLCSSHDKGCHPYMCGTSFRHSNCLDQYKKAYTKVITPNSAQPVNGSTDDTLVLPDSDRALEKSEVTELACPLCRGKVKGWTVVEPAREYLNAKTRTCMHDDCSFVGCYKELKKHVRSEHASSRPCEVDPADEQKWRRFQWDREREDVISTIRSTMPGSMVFGDYVIERNHGSFDMDEEGELDADGIDREQGGLETDMFNFFLLLHAFRQSGNDHNRRFRPESAFDGTADQSDLHAQHSALDVEFDTSVQGFENGSYFDEGDDRGTSLASRLRRHNGIVLGRSRGRRRGREGDTGRG